MKPCFPLTLALWLTSALCGGVHAQTAEHIGKSGDSGAMKASYDKAVQSLAERGFDDLIDTPAMGAAASEKIESLRRAINQPFTMTAFGLGSPTVQYDVILQPGHYKRPPGLVGTSGKNVSERELVAYIVNGIGKELQRKGMTILVVPADGSIKGLRTKIFLSIHADGAAQPCTTGPSLAYESKSSLLAMHAMGWAQAQALGYNYDEFRKDGYTANEAHYYMFSRVNATLMKGLLEVGELTCKDVEPRLISSADIISKNLANAIVFVAQSQN